MADLPSLDLTPPAEPPATSIDTTSPEEELLFAEEDTPFATEDTEEGGAPSSAPTTLLLPGDAVSLNAATDQAHWFDNAGRVVLASAHANAR